MGPAFRTIVATGEQPPVRVVPLAPRACARPTVPDPVPSRSVGAIFVLPNVPTRTSPPQADYLSTAGWAAAAARVLGTSWIVTPFGILDPAEARRKAAPAVARPETTAPDRSTPDVGTLARRYTPAIIKTLAKDLRDHRRAARFDIDPHGPWAGDAVDFVWQRHELFQTAGLDLARKIGVPSVLFVPSTKVWEADQWGTRRPGWGPLTERAGEQPALQRADVVACGSAEVAEQAVRLGTPQDRILITPTGVDLDLFDVQGTGRDGQRQALGLEGRFVIGWVGSFRPFHAVGRLIDAAPAVADVSLLLVGDGPEREHLEALAARRGVHAVFTGSLPHGDLPRHLAAMDVGVVLANAGAGFHYSPLKLAEYLAAGLPVVAPGVAQVARRLTDGTNALLVAPDRPEELRTALERLRSDDALRAEIGRRGRQVAEEQWSWDLQVRRVLDAVGARR